MNPQDPCPCGTKKPYSQCCQPYHQGQHPENALLLMRSRYSAYVFNLPDYIIATTHPANPQYSDNTFSWKRSIANFSKNSVFQRLEVLDFKESNTIATVTFTVFLTQKDEDATFTEKSYFEKFQGRWLYRGGQLSEGHAPNMVTTGQLRLLPLAYYGDAVLRQKAEPVKEITSDIKKLIEEMIETMNACDGMGLAAPQVHHSIRLFVIRMPIETDEEVSLGEVKVFINPVLISESKETWEAPEGCLSIPSLRAMVERPKEIVVEYTNLEGKRLTEQLSGWAAKVVLHENDHIDGVLYVDRLPKEEREKIAPFLQVLEKRIHDGKAL